MSPTVRTQGGVDRSSWSTSGVSVSEYKEWVESRHVPRGYRASSHSLVRLADPDTIGRLLGEAVRRVSAAVIGPSWIIDADNPAHLEAYRLAAEDARRRARAYTEALGLRLGSLEALEEPGLSHADPIGVVTTAYRSARSEEIDLALNPGTVDVSAAVIATFSLVENAGG